MKTITKVAAVLLATALVVSCNNSSNSADKERIAELEEKIAELQTNLNNNKTSSVKTSTSTSERTSSRLYSRSKEENIAQWVGTYEFTDEAGNTWQIILNSDETALFEPQGGGSKRYGSWDYLPYYFPCLNISHDESPTIYFPDGPDSWIDYVCITDGYLYASNIAAKAKNPNKRLPIKKIR